MTAAPESESESDDGLLTEVVEKSSVGIAAFVAERVLLTGVAYVVTTASGAAAYGFLSVLIRGETVSRNLVAGLGDGYTRTVPRVSASARRTLLSVGTVGFVAVWAAVAAPVVVFRGDIVAATLLEPRHESGLVLFALGLLPFLLLRNFRDMLRALRRIKLAMLVSRVFAPLALLAGATVVVAAGGRSLFGLWAGIVGVVLALTVVGALLLFSTTTVQFGSVRAHRQVVRDFLSYSVDTTGVATLELVQRRAVFVVMALYLSPVAAGAFSLSVVVALIVRWPLSGVNGILPPIAATLYQDGRTRTLQQLYRQTSRLATVAATPVFVLGYTYAPELLAVFNDAYVRQAAVLRVVLVAQYAATVFGSVGLLLLMTDNERASLLTQVVNASVALPLMILLAARFGPLGLGAAYLLSLLVNNTTELLVLQYCDGLAPFSREQAYAVLSTVPAVYTLLSIKPIAGATTSLTLAVVVLAVYTWLGRQFLLRSADRAAVRALVT
jgi:O-antigen/teichoic acid export membrane protein